MRKILRTPTVWRLSGLTYPTAVLATHGSLRSPSDYVDDCRVQMSPLLPFFHPSQTCLEFGQGLGGNLIAVHQSIGRGLGIDINAGFSRIARALAHRFDASNLDFVTYSGLDPPSEVPEFDVIFSIGVFERIPHWVVDRIVSWMTAHLRQDGKLLLYFLMDRARGSSFSSLLGPDAYFYWTESELSSLFARHSLRESGSWHWNPSAKQSFADIRLLVRS